MAVSRVKTWISGEILFASDLNAEIDNVLTNGESLAWPATVNKDLDGNALILDADADSSISATTDDRVDIVTGGVTLFRFDGTVASAVNGFDFKGSATTGDVSIDAFGTDTNINVRINAKGSGSFIFGSLALDDTSADHQYLWGVNELVADRTVTMPLLTGNDTFVFASHAETLANKTLTLPQLNDTSSDHQYITAVSELAADRTVTMPLLGANDEFVFKDHAVTLTNKTLTSPVINTQVTGTAVLDEDDMSSDSATQIPTQQSVKAYVDAHGLVKSVIETTATVFNVSTQMPRDDSIPQNTEGDEILTVSITPTNTNNILRIAVDTLLGATASQPVDGSMAIFQDSTAGALAATTTSLAAGQVDSVSMRHSMIAGTTSSTTFKLRVGPGSIFNVTVNGRNGARLFGGVAITRITVEEHKV